MLFQKIDTTKAKRRFVVADVHGCCKTLKALLEDTIKLTKEDYVFFLGDYINRGPDSRGVVELIMFLQNNAYPVFALRGNHEQMLMDSDRNPLFEDTLPRLQKREGITELSGRIVEELRPFFEQLPYYFELEDCFLVHAGFNFLHANPLSDFEQMLWIRNFGADISKIGGKRLIHGHTVKNLIEIKEAVTQKSPVIPLDNGCYYGVKNSSEVYMGQLGNLCCLELNEWELTVLPCSE